jgi:rfaE bifunctional protein nucleotidyltransferase chain/domain
MRFYTINSIMFTTNIQGAAARSTQLSLSYCVVMHIGVLLISMTKKILDSAALKSTIEQLRKKGKKIVFTNGCFDIIHAGHADYLQKAREFGDCLIIGLNSDSSIKAIKGEKRPVVRQDYRLKLISALECVDFVTVFDEDTPETLIRSIKPDVLVKGADWEGKQVAGAAFVKENGGTVKFIKMLPGISTTEIIERILSTYGGQIR